MIEPREDERFCNGCNQLVVDGFYFKCWHFADEEEPEEFFEIDILADEEGEACLIRPIKCIKEFKKEVVE